MRKFYFLVLTVIYLGLNSCATIFSGSNQAVSFETIPSGAEVKTVKKNGEEQTIGVTPCTVPISKKTKSIKFIKSNFYDEVYPMSSNLKLNSWYYVDLVGCITIVGIPSAVVDAVTNSYFNLPKQVKVELKKK
jgi:hypothetical protein